MVKKKYFRKKTKECKEKTSSFLKNNKVFTLIFILTTIFFVYENITAVSWDLSVFNLNAQQMFSESTYYEVGRPPLASLIIGIYGLFFNWAASEALYVLTVAILFAYAIYSLSKTLNFEPAVLYAFSMNFYVLNKALSVGTELLSLALLTIAVNMILRNNSFSGLFLGLVALTRYTGLVLFPLAIFHYNIKKIITSLVLFGAVILSWLIYNFIIFGNMFESIANQYMLNVINRQDLVSPANPLHFLEVLNLLTPFFILGLGVVLTILVKKTVLVLKTKDLERRKNNLKNLLVEKKAELVVLVIAIYVTYSYLTTPLKISRYLFFLVLPGIYFSYLGLKSLLEKYKLEKYAVKVSLVIFLTSLLIFLTFFAGFEKPDKYEEGISLLDEYNLNECYVESNAWPIINQLGKQASPPPRQEYVEDSIEEGKLLLLFKDSREPDYVQDKEFINNLPVIHENKDLYLIGKESCKAEEPYHKSYIEQFNQHMLKANGYEINTNPCFIIFKDKLFLEQACNLLNNKGFKKDENRAIN